MFRQILPGVVCVMVIALVFGLVAPRATQAAFAALVQVTNSPTQPVPVANGRNENGSIRNLEVRDADNPAQQVIQFLVQPDAPGNGSNQAESDIPVPSGKVFVIEYVSAEIAGGFGDVFMETTAGGHLVAYYFVKHSTPDLHQFFLTRIYADPGSTVKVFVFSDDGNPAQADVEISGHYVNVP